MRTRTLLVLVVLFLAAAVGLMVTLGPGTSGDAREARHDRIAGYARTAAREMVYVRDERTGLCYAFWWQRYDRSGAPAMANVPCEPVASWLEGP